MTIICEKCGTRNLPDNSHCRRCKSEIFSHSNDTQTEQLIDENSVLNSRWKIEKAVEDRNLFRGRDLKNGASVLIRRLDRISARDRTLRGQFLNEAKLISGIHSPHFVRILDVIDSETPALVMEAPHGESLHHFVNQNGLVPISVALLFFKQLLNALSLLHDSGISHRNLNPNNIYIGPHPETSLPHITITDFALANSMHKAQGSDTGTLIGMKVSNSIGIRANSYMPPELLIDKHDFRSDLYSLGAVLFYILTQRVPIASAIIDENEIAELIRKEVPTSVRMIRPEIPRELDELITLLLSKSPNQRPIDCEAVLRHVKAIQIQSMVSIAKGTFTRGCSDHDDACRPEEKPSAQIFLDGFLVDRFPVSVQDYRTFIAATGLKVSENWTRFNPPSKNDHPVVFVSHHDATDYAKWAGKRLPTEAEWEKSARGSDNPIFPWGNESPSSAHAHFDRKLGTSSIGQHVLGKSAYGVEDLSGNVFEWVSDWYGKSYYETPVVDNPQGPTVGSKKILKGGSFVHDASALRISSRGRYKPEECRANHGFRCVWSINDH